MYIYMYIYICIYIYIHIYIYISCMQYPVIHVFLFFFGMGMDKSNMFERCQNNLRYASIIPKSLAKPAVQVIPRKKALTKATLW